MKAFDFKFFSSPSSLWDAFRKKGFRKILSTKKNSSGLYWPVTFYNASIYILAKKAHHFQYIPDNYTVSFTDLDIKKQDDYFWVKFELHFFVLAGALTNLAWA